MENANPDADDEQQYFNLTELVDLALCTPEIGTVNFNILRILLHDIVQKLGIESLPVDLGDVETNQVAKYKGYIAGNAQHTPMPGVLQVSHPGYSYGVKSATATGEPKTIVATTPSMQPNASPRTPRTGRMDMAVGPEKTTTEMEQPKRPSFKTQQTATDAARSPSPPPSTTNNPASPRLLDVTKALEEKVGRLERHLDALYQLPTNQSLLDTKGGGIAGGMTVNDMWQIIQLNNRVASCESAIQKMATLIEDLATDLSSLKNDTRSFQSDADNLKSSHSRLSTDLYPLHDKCTLVKDALDELKKDLHAIQHQWKKELEKVTKSIGVDPQNVPSFLRPTPSTSRQPTRSQRTRSKSKTDKLEVDAEWVLPSQPTSAGSDSARCDSHPPDFRAMSPESIALYPVSKLACLPYSELDKITPSIMELMTPDQLDKIQEMITARPLPDINMMRSSQIKHLRLADLQKLTPSEAAEIKPSKMVHMTPNQRKLVEEIKKGNQGKEEPKTDNLEAENLSKVTADAADAVGHRSLTPGTDSEKRKSELSKTSKHHGKPRHHRHRSHSPVDVLHGKIPVIEASPNLDQNDTKNMVQAELQKQYAHLQSQQRQLANDIQNKMEFIYEKLLREIATQHERTLPYMAVGEPEKPLGPGLCTGFGMPAGIAVCQFPDADGRQDKGTHQPPGPTDPRVCPGPGICPQSANCPHCGPASAKSGASGPAYLTPAAMMQTQIQMQEQQNKQELGTGPAGIGQQVYRIQTSGNDAEKELLLRDMRSLVLLDLESIRNDMKNRDSTFDEQDIVERLDTIWEAIKIVKNNEETLAIKILRQDAILRKLPNDTIDRLNKIPVENLEAIASAKWDKPMMLPNGTVGGTIGKSANSYSKLRNNKDTLGIKSLNATGGDSGGGSSSIDKEGVQNIYNNLANLMAETTDHKNKLERLGDVVRTMEVGMVTKQMLVDALGDKADKGQINTKVSYDEFGTAIEELHSALRDLVVEGFNKNDHWQEVTDHLAQDVNNKLDRIELTPVKAFFKSNLKALGEKVRLLQQQMEEPDPAGTRKKLLRDFNCISCDRQCNISGVTNAPTLPTLGPIRAGHTTASRRAFDLHRMRMQNKFDHDCRDMKTMESQMRSLGFLNPDGTVKTASQLTMVNRFQGGSHTAITTSARIRSIHRPSQKSAFQNNEDCGDECNGEEEEIITAVPELQGFVMPQEDLEQAEETEELIQSYIPAFTEE